MAFRTMTRTDKQTLVLMAAMCVAVAVLLASCLIPEDLSECDTNADCRDQYSKRAYCADDDVCETYTREEYLAPPCDYETFGEPYESDEPVIGAILAASANNDNLLTSVQVAYEEFQNAGVNLSVVVCSSESELERARQAANHLAQIGVKAIVGPDSSSQVIQLGQDIFVPNQMLSVSPAATSSVISTLQDEDLLWRTIPSDEFQASAVAKLALTRLGLSPDAESLGDQRLLVAAKENDSYSQGLRSGVIDTLATSLTNSSNFKVVSFANPNDVTGTPSYASVGETIQAFDPDVAMVFGTEEVWSVIESTEDQYEAASSERPLYVGADGVNVNVSEDGQAQSAIESYPELVTDSRVIGTRPATDYSGNPVYSSFANTWESNQDLDPGQSASDFPFIAEAYDAFFVVGLASLGVDSFTGPNLADTIPMLADPTGEVLDAQSDDIGTVINKFSNETSFQLRGATGPLNFDEEGNPQGGTVALWCLEGSGSNSAATQTASNYLVNQGSEFTARDCPESTAE